MAMEMVRVLPDPEAIKVQYGLTKEFTEKNKSAMRKSQRFLPVNPISF